MDAVVGFGIKHILGSSPKLITYSLMNSNRASVCQLQNGSDKPTSSNTFRMK